MTALLIKLLARTAIFGVVLTYLVRKDPGLKVEPRSALPVVALVFALLNTALYHVLATTLNVFTLFIFFLIVPFVANALLLMATDKFLRPFRIDSMTALLRASVVLTLVHVLLRIVHL